MNSPLETDLEQTNVALEKLYEIAERTEQSQVSMEYLDERALQDVEVSFGMENRFFEAIRDSLTAAGRLSIAIGQGFVKFLDTIHRLVDTTYLVKVRQLRDQIKKVPASEALVKKGRMERRILARALSVNGQVEMTLPEYGRGIIALSQRISSDVLPAQALTARTIAQHLQAKSDSGTHAFVESVADLIDVVGSAKFPKELFKANDFDTLWPGNRTIFRRIKPSRPRREPYDQSSNVRRLVRAVTDTDYGIRGKVEVSGIYPDTILPILNPRQCETLLDTVEAMLKEAVRLKGVAKNYAKDRVPSTLALSLKGFISGMRRQWDDFWTAEDDGFDHFEGPSGAGVHQRVKRGKRNPLGGLTRGMESIQEVSAEARKKDEEDEIQVRDRILQAVWVSRYTQLSLIDHQQTAKAMILLLVGVARTYMEYIEESLDYYS